jgi:Flp pilus assembly protein TadD
MKSFSFRLVTLTALACVAAAGCGKLFRPADIAVEKGDAAVARGDWASASTHYSEAIRIDPRNHFAHNGLGVALAATGRPEGAISHFGMALGIAPDYAEAHNNLGNALVAKGRTDEAKACFQKALAIQPEHVESLNNLARLLATCPDAKVRDGAEAVKLAEKADRLCGGKRADVLDTLATAQAEAGHFSEAVATAKKAAELAAKGKDKKFAGKLRQRLALYEASKPFRQPPPVAPAAPQRP